MRIATRNAGPMDDPMRVQRRETGNEKVLVGGKTYLALRRGRDIVFTHRVLGQGEKAANEETVRLNTNETVRCARLSKKEALAVKQQLREDIIAMGWM